MDVSQTCTQSDFGCSFVPAFLLLGDQAPAVLKAALRALSEQHCAVALALGPSKPFDRKSHGF